MLQSFRMEINRNTIIKDLIETNPETLAVFKKYNLVIAGGVRGPNEPIAFFAKAHEVNYDTLVKELNEAIEKGGGEHIEISRKSYLLQILEFQHVHHHPFR